MDANTPTVTPAGDSTPPAKPPETFATWFRANGTSAVVTAAMVVAVCYFLHPLDVLLAIVGLGGIVFLHELGHFVAAKACGVHVKTFAVGFGPPLPFCHFRYGETHYKLAMIPLGGYVAMVGEGDAKGDVVDADTEPDEIETYAKDYPRSFANKPVWQRMIVISAGVIMNILLAAVCFVVVYLHGVEEMPALVQAVDPGSAAWRAGIRPGEELVKLNELENNPSENKKRLWFDDIRPVVSSTDKGETVAVTTVFKGETRTYDVVPVRAEGALFPQLGISPPQSLTLLFSRRDTNPPFDAGSPASLAKAADGSGFQSKDRVVAMTDPDTGTVTDIPDTPDGKLGGQFEFRRRLHRLAGQEVKVRVLRAGQPDDAPRVEIVLPRTYRKDLGLRMKPGQVTAVRTGSPAEKAGLLSRIVTKGEVEREGDELLAVTVTDAGKPLTFDATTDPLRLPLGLFVWADNMTRQPVPDWKVTATIRRAGAPLTVVMTWDDSYRTEPGPMLSPASPVPLDGLGLAFQVSSTVHDLAAGSAAAKAGAQKGDVITNVRFKAVDFKGTAKDGSWQPVGASHFAYLDSTLQIQAPHAVDLKVDRGGTEVELLDLTAADDTGWPVAAGGLIFGKELRILKADGVGEALGLGLQRTVRMVKNTYQGLYALVAGRVSVKVMSGPITLARAGYILAGESVWKLILLIGLISVNLAVVNFLPIPVLDGGHMVFLIYEGVRGKPAPVLVQNVLTVIGLAAVLSLMLFTIGLDIWRLLFW